MKASWQPSLRDFLVDLLGSDYARVQFRPSGTGCINDTWEAYGSGLQSLFLKTGPVSAHAMYECEVRGLEALRQCESIRVPQVLANPVLANPVSGSPEQASTAVLVLEFIRLRSPSAADDVAIADGLAQLHALPGSAFGFDGDNFIGRTPQVNQYRDDWWTFWCECRLRPQWRLAQLKGMRSALLDRLEALIERIPAFFGEHQPQPVLLHGDLWSGNLALDENDRLCLFDPAVYYGDRETDIAMTRMFGALRPGVYARYHAVHPESKGADTRRVLYDLYHWLNHFNLFGVTYLGQAENSVETLLKWMENQSC